MRKAMKSWGTDLYESLKEKESIKMRKAFKSWGTNLYESLKEKVEEATSTSGKELKPSSFVQVIRELTELDLQHREDFCIADTIGSYQNENYGQVMEWVSKVEKFLAEIKPEVGEKGNGDNSFWCHNMILRIRKIQAKRSPSLTYQRVRDVGSSSINMRTMAPLSLREVLYGEITFLINTTYTLRTCNTFHAHQERKIKIPRDIRQGLDNIEKFLEKIKQQLQEKVDPETNSDWYSNKIAEMRMLTDISEPEDELGRERKLLNRFLYIDFHVVNAISAVVQDQHERDKYLKEVQEMISKIDKVLNPTETIHAENSDWCRNKIAESRTLTAIRYSAFPLRSQDVVYTNEQFQIFLSFRGEDTRYGFTRNLYDALYRKGFNVFMDDEGLQSGDSISQVLMGAIEKSKLSIIVFSENFADSTWCLDEVVKILECKQKNNQQVWPIFYKVDPSDVRHQRNSYENAMIKQETKFGKNSDKVKNWRSALHEVCGLKACHYKENSGYEGAFIQDIIKDAKHIRDHL